MSRLCKMSLSVEDLTAIKKALQLQLLLHPEKVDAVRLLVRVNTLLISAV